MKGESEKRLLMKPNSAIMGPNFLKVWTAYGNTLCSETSYNLNKFNKPWTRTSNTNTEKTLPDWYVFGNSMFSIIIIVNNVMYQYETTVNGRLRVLLMHISSPTPHCNHVRSKNNTVRNELVGASRLDLACRMFKWHDVVRSYWLTCWPPW